MSDTNITEEINWESIEIDYRAGVLPVETLARKYKVTPAQIRAQAKAGHWEREANDVSRETVVRRGHERLLYRSRLMVDTLLHRLEESTRVQMEMEDAEMERADTAIKDGLLSDAEYDAIRRTITARVVEQVGGAASILKDVSVVMKTSIGMEREYGMANAPPAQNSTPVTVMGDIASLKALFKRTVDDY